MGVLNEIVSQLNKEEVRHLKIFLNRTNAEKSRKDVQLFDMLRKQANSKDESKIVEQLYGGKDKNTFYRLKNRLLEDIGKSLSLQHFNSVDANSILYNMALSRLFHRKSQFKIASYYLQKAERKATDIASYELMDVIYSDFIKLSQESLSINPEIYLEKRKQNSESLNKIRDIDDILAVLIHRIRLSHNYSKQGYQVAELLQKTIDDLSLEGDLTKNPKLRFRIYHALSRILLQQHNYEALEEYLLVTLQEFTDEQLFNKNNHDTKLQMLTYLANALWKNNKLNQSLEYLKKLKSGMDEFNGLLNDKYLFYYYNTLIACYSDQDVDKAIETLNEAIENPVIKKATPQAILVFQLNLALRYFDVGNYKQASRRAVRLKLDDTFSLLDKAFQMKINIVELIFRFEQKDFDFIEYQSESILKEYADLFTSGEYKRQAKVLELMKQMIYTSSPHKEAALAKMADWIQNDTPDDKAADTDILSYNEWLRKHFNKD